MLIHAAVDDDLHPPASGGRQRGFGLARGLAARHDVRVLCVVPNRSTASAEERIDGVTLLRRRAWHTSVAWRLERAGVAPLFTAASGHGARAADYRRALGADPDVLSCDLNLTGLLPRSRARLRVYASQNVEADRFLASRSRLLARPFWAARLRALEGGAVRGSDLTVTCSDEDAARLRDLYGARSEAVAVIPNGYDERVHRPPTAAEREAARVSLGIGGQECVALFVGADWGPNREAMTCLVERIGPAVADAGVLLLVVGSVGRDWSGRREPWLRVLGEVADLRTALHAADVGLNPVAEGGGSNVKVPGYLAAGLACVTTPFGLRGYADLAAHCTVVERSAMADALRSQPRGWAARGDNAPAVLADYAWAALGERLGRLYEAHLDARTHRGAA